jgi:hypothetical protein
MKHFTYKLPFVLLLVFLAATHAEARQIVKPQMYMFGFAASFNDTIVHFTDVMAVDSVMIDKKSGFLTGRELYSKQMRDYMESQMKMPHRTCVVFYDENLKRIMKKYMNMRKLYSVPEKGAQHFDVRDLDDKNFRFKRLELDTNELSDEELYQQQTAKKTKPKKEKRGK